ncbi:MAG: VWA domain-containing protein [Nocardioidaceae bacterium]
MRPPAPPLLRSVDRASFVVAFGHRLRRAGVPVTAPALAAFTDALGVSPPHEVRELYWSARLTMVNRARDLDTFDAVFAAVFDTAALPLEGQAAGPSGDDEVLASVAADVGGQETGDGLPWHTLPRSVLAEDDEGIEGPALPELLPSAVEAVADVPFERLDPAQLALVGSWLEQSRQRWPTRRSRRRRVHHAGRRIELRETIAASRRTAWEPVELSRSRPVRRPRTITMVADVSRSMQPYSAAYLHLMRALARSRRAEAFAFSTTLTRVTPALRHHSVEVAVREASELVVDRFGGTHLASSLAQLIRSRHGSSLRGGVLVVASDGWDSDDPEQLAGVLARVRRRVHRLVWLNPRAGAEGFQPLVGSMAAALPFCDDFLPAHTLRAMTEALDAILEPGGRPLR